MNILGWKGPISIIVAPQRTTQSSNPTSDSIVLTLLELQQLRAMPAALKSLFHAHHPLMKNFSLTPSCLTQLYAIPSGPIAVTETRAQSCLTLPVRSCRHHEGTPQLLCYVLSTLRDCSCSSYVLPSGSFIIFIALFWMLSNRAPYTVAPNLHAVLEVRPHSTYHRGQSLPSPGGSTGPAAPQGTLGPLGSRAYCCLTSCLLSDRTP